MNIVLARIDNRLLHGIIVSQWAGTTGANRVMVIDDIVANSSFMKSSMQLAKPPGMASSIITLESALANFQSDKYHGQKLFLLVKEPSTILTLLEAGIPMKHLCIGATERINEGIKLSNRAFITEEEAAVYRRIHALGTKITVQHVPSVTAVDLFSIIEK